MDQSGYTDHDSALRHAMEMHKYSCRYFPAHDSELPDFDMERMYPDCGDKPALSLEKP